MAEAYRSRVLPKRASPISSTHRLGDDLKRRQQQEPKEHDLMVHSFALVAAPNEVMSGLRARPKRLPCRLLYDARGTELFEQICRLDEYYVTRSELALLDHHLLQICASIGPAARVIEPGSGAGTKTRMLLAALDAPVEYVPIDVSADQLAHTAAALQRAFPRLAVNPVSADYTNSIALPPAHPCTRRTVVFFPGSTIGNFEPDEASWFLERWSRIAGPDAMILIGADSNNDPDSLVSAYDDRNGVTAAFNLNILSHINRTHGATFDLGAFAHRAVWNAAKSRVEMHLVSVRTQSVWISGERVVFERGEPIVTEHCYKHSPARFESLLDRAGWRALHAFVDPSGCVGLWLAERKRSLDADRQRG
jgi:L-histidine Nalpha-methyltransferase